MCRLISNHGPGVANGRGSRIEVAAQRTCPARCAGFISRTAESDRMSVALVAEAFSRFGVAVYAMRVGITEQHPAGTYWDSLEAMAKAQEKSQRADMSQFITHRRRKVNTTA